MVGNEGVSLYPVYFNYSLAGFDPDKDMLEVNSLPVEAFIGRSPKPSLGGQERTLGFAGGYGGLVFDWDLRSSLEGLYSAGNVLAGGGTYSTSACTGRYAGRKAAEYALRSAAIPVDRNQVDREKKRVYAPVKRKNGVGWKELMAGIGRVMKEYCPAYKNENMLNAGLRWLEDIRENEGAAACARNPHELQRILEGFRQITSSEIILHASLARKSSSNTLDFHRLDYPETDSPEWHKYVTIKQRNGEVNIGELPLNYWLLPPYAPTYRENYEKHCSL
jgi:succinate dehydrogenase/fumarate reductase flavoprotein subunit